ncbi:MAG: NGG1p interacting factor NIF3 [Pseudomonadota bacterium]
MYQLFFYVPETHLETVKAALFAAGAGRLGLYEHCCWQVKGQGQFRPLAGADPHIGTVGAVEQVDEYRVEMVVDAPHLPAVLAALHDAHPYETVAHGVVRLENAR